MSEAATPDPGKDPSTDELAARLAAGASAGYCFEGLDPNNPRHMSMFQYAAVSRFIAAHPSLIGYRRSGYEHVLLHLGVNMWPVDMSQVVNILGRVMGAKEEEGKTAGYDQLTDDELAVNEQRLAALSKEKVRSVVAPGGWRITETHTKLVDWLLDFYNRHKADATVRGLAPETFNTIVARLTTAVFGVPRDLTTLTEPEAEKMMGTVSQYNMAGPRGA